MSDFAKDTNVPTNDCISRQAAIEALKNMYEAAEKWGYEATDEVIKARAESCMASHLEMKLRIENLPSAQPEIIRCKDCKHFHTDVFQEVNGIPLIVAHEICDFWGDGCKTTQDGYCAAGERRSDD